MLVPMVIEKSQFGERGYDIFGDLRWDEDELNRRTQYDYDKMGRLTTATRPVRLNSA